MSNPIVIADLAHHGLEPADTFQGLLDQVKQAAAGQPSRKYQDIAKRLPEAIKAAVGRQASLKTVKERLGDPLLQAKQLKRGIWIYDVPEGQGLFEFGTVLHALVLLAQDLGLTVLADHLGVAFLPQRRIVLGLDTGTNWKLLFEGQAGEGTDDSAMTRPQMIKRVLQMMGDKHLDWARDLRAIGDNFIRRRSAMEAEGAFSISLYVLLATGHLVRDVHLPELIDEVRSRLVRSMNEQAHETVRKQAALSLGKLDQFMEYLDKHVAPLGPAD